MSEETHIKAPNGVDFTINIYLTSDKTGLNACVRVRGLKTMTHFRDDIDPMEIVRSTGFPDLEKDEWRLMAAAEIKEYREDEEE